VRLLGVALILLGLTLLASPGVPYTRRQKIGDSRYSVKSERFLVVPRPISVLIMASGALALFLARKRGASS
jgi:hypothetical protein